MSDLVRAGSLGKGGLGGVGRQTRVEKPRPLKMSGGTQPELSPEDLLVVVDAVLKGLTNRQYDDQMVGQVASLCANLKRSGAQMESSHKEWMDRLLSAMVAACRDDSLHLVTRVHMLEIIELRSMGWQTNENVTNYYKQKLAQIDAPTPKSQTAPVQLNPTAPDFNPGQKESLLCSRGVTVAPPPRKVGPDMTPSSRPRPRPPHTKGDREHQGQGSLQGEGDTPPRLPGANPQPSATVTVGNQQLVVSGASSELVRTARVVLHEFFNVCGGPNSSSVLEDANMESPPPERDLKPQSGARSAHFSGETRSNRSSESSISPGARSNHSSESSMSPGARSNHSSESSVSPGARSNHFSGESSHSVSSVAEDDDDGPELILVKPELSYEKAELLQLAKSPLCRATPERWSELVADLPGVVRRADRAGPTSKLILREMEEIRRQEAAPKFQ